jgi:hypothetical protein
MIGNNRIEFFILMLAGIFFTSSVFSNDKVDFEFKISPKNNSIDGIVTWSFDEKEKIPKIFYLNKTFKIAKVLVDGEKKDFKFDLNGEPPPYVDIARPIKLSILPKKTITFEYSGNIGETISDVNQIKPELVELALYCAFYPFLVNRTFEFRGIIELPNDFNVFSNGDVVRGATLKDDTQYKVSSTQLSNDIVLISSPALNSKVEKFGSLSIEMIYTNEFKDMAEIGLKYANLASNNFSKKFGIATKEDGLKFAYSPRSGWGYSRLPLFVVSGERTKSILKRKFGKESDIKGNTHELSHFWWSIADTSTVNDWINEGLAEYSALSFAFSQFGKEYVKFAIEQYFTDIEKVKGKDPIINTDQTSSHRYVNWYEKNAVLLFYLENKVGEQKFSTFLKKFYNKHKKRRDATTTSFLKEAEIVFPNEDFIFLKRYLTSEGWSLEMIKNLKSKLIGYL